MKQAVVESYQVTLTGGTLLSVCCGPAVLALGTTVRAYKPNNDAREDICCHTGSILRGAILDAERQAHEYKELYDVLNQPIELLAGNLWVALLKGSILYR